MERKPLISTEQKWQLGSTFGVGAVFCYFMWSKMEAVSKGLIGLFAVIAAMSSQQGTWMLNHRDIRRQDRDARRQVYSDTKQWLGFGTKTTKKA